MGTSPAVMLKKTKTNPEIGLAPTVQRSGYFVQNF